MNDRQLKCFWAAMILVVGFGIWFVVDKYSLSFLNLCVVWFMIALVASGFIYTFKGKPKSKNDDSNNNKGR